MGGPMGPQEQVNDWKEDQLQVVQTAVKSKIENSVKKQFKSYSEAFQENVVVCKPKSDSVSPGIALTRAQSRKRARRAADWALVKATLEH